MTTTFTNSLRLWKGQPGDPAIKGAWGLPLDTNQDLIDSAINGTAIVNVAGQTSVTLSANNGAPDQSRELVQQFAGALSAVCTVSIPNVPKYGWAQNATTGGFNIVLSAGAGSDATIPPDGRLYFYACDGATNVVLPTVGFGGALSVGGGLVVGGNTLINGGLTVTQPSSFVGVTDGSNAAAGQIGEYISASAASVQLASNVAQSVVPINLSAGDWEVSGNVSFLPQSGVSSLVVVSASFVGGTVVPFTAQFNSILNNGFFRTGMGPTRQNSNSEATIAISMLAVFSGPATVQGTAFIQARRIR